MTHQIRIKPSARKNLDTILPKDRDKIIQTFDDIANNPYIGKKLSGKRRGQYSVRVWPYRIVYIIVKKELVVLVIGA